MLSVPSYYFRKDTSFRLRNVDKTKSMVINGKKRTVPSTVNLNLNLDDKEVENKLPVPRRHNGQDRRDGSSYKEKTLEQCIWKTMKVGTIYHHNKINMS